MITPESEDAVADLLSSENAERYRITGGGTRGVAAEANATLSTGGLTGISLYEPGALTLVAGAGTPLSEIEAALDGEGQMMAFEPMDHRDLLGTSGTPTLGGVAAMNVSGPRRIQAGAARDAMLGVRFVDGAGQIIKNGGRVMKNVTGYDLVKLMAGSFGTLGVLTEVAVKVLPKPEFAATLMLEGLDDNQAISALSSALTSPFDVTGAAHAPTAPDGPPVTMIRLEGFETSVLYRAGELQKRLAIFGDAAVMTDQAKVAATWGSVRDVTAFAKTPGDVWKISVKPSDGPKVATALRAETTCETLYDWGGGLVWALLPAGFNPLPHLSGIAGHATRMRGQGAGPSRSPIPAPLAALSTKLKSAFDPMGRLNPGVMEPLS